MPLAQHRHVRNRDVPEATDRVVVHGSVLRSRGNWEPIKKSDAKRLGLKVEEFSPTHKAEEFGLVLDLSVWFEASIAPRWRVAFRLANQGGQPVIAEVRVFPDEPGERPAGRWSGEYGVKTKVPPGGITARVLRQIRTQTFRRELSAIRKRHAEHLGELARSDPSFPLTSAPSLTTRGRKGRSDRELARIALAYEAAYASGRPAIAAVAKAARLSLTKARDAVHRARTRGLLSPASKRGKGGGLLTPLGREILKQGAKSKGGKRHGKKR